MENMQNWEEITQSLYKEDNYRRMSEVYDIILSYIQKDKTGLNILDIGCGDGSLLNKIANNNLYGIDISPEQLEIAKSRGIKAQNINIDKQNLPYPDNYFDIIISSEVIEHVLVPDNLLKETYRVLKKDGIFILTTPNLASFGKRLLLLFNKNPFIEISPLEENAVGHLRYFIYPTLLNIIKKYHFRLKKFTSDVINFDGKGIVKSRFLAHLIPTLGRTLIFLMSK